MNEQAVPQAKDWLWEDLHSCWSYCMPEKGLARTECNMRLLGEHNSEPLAHNTQQPWPEMKACLVIQWLVVAQWQSTSSYLDNRRHLPLLPTHLTPSNVFLRLPLQLRVNHTLFNQDTTPLNLDSNRLHLTIVSTPK